MVFRGVINRESHLAIYLEIIEPDEHSENENAGPDHADYDGPDEPLCHPGEEQNREALESYHAAHGAHDSHQVFLNIEQA